MAIIYWTSNALGYILQDKYSALGTFMIVILIEHIIIGLKLMLAILIKDKPEWVSQTERRQKLMMGDIFDLFDQKGDYQKETTDKKPLNERIQEIKEKRRLAIEQQDRLRDKRTNTEEEDHEFKALI